ncbi:MAG: dephospho-CoA kinase [Halothermotrichaceae bacterium]
MIIGLTGGIASGKTTVSNLLKKLGAVIIDADKIAHQVLETKTAREKVISYFGSAIIDNNQINRKKLGKIVFNNSEEKKKLEEITHPMIIDIIKMKIKQYSKKNDIIVVDAPLLLETNLDKIVDSVWVVYVNKKTQLKRLMNRDNINLYKAKKRINSQMPLAKKRKLADIVIDNNGSKKELEQKVKKICREINNEN